MTVWSLSNHKATSELQSLHLVFVVWSLGRFLMDIANKTRLANLSWNILVTWPNQRNWDLSIRRRGSAFKVLRISQLRTMLRNITPWTLLKNRIFAICTWDSTNRRYPKFVTIVEDSNKDWFKNRQFCGVWKLHFATMEQWSSRSTSFALPTSYQSSCSFFRHSWITISACTSWPAAVYCRLLALCSDTSFWRDQWRSKREAWGLRAPGGKLLIKK